LRLLTVVVGLKERRPFIALAQAGAFANYRLQHRLWEGLPHLLHAILGLSGSVEPRSNNRADGQGGRGFDCSALSFSGVCVQPRWDIHCEYCRVGRGNLCANWNAIGDTVNGAFAEYVAVPAANAYRLPDGVDDQQGALIEPLSCAVHGLRRIGPVLGEDVLLIGAGTMGLLLLQLLNRAGARSVTVVDRKATRLEVAKTVGAASVAGDVPEADRGTFGVAVDATGVPAAIESAFGALARGGRLMIFGVASADAAVSLSPFRIYNDEITVVGSMAVLNSFGAAADLMAAGAIDTGPLLGPPFALDQFPEALTSVRNGEGVKIQVVPGG